MVCDLIVITQWYNQVSLLANCNILDRHYSYTDASVNEGLLKADGSELF